MKFNFPKTKLDWLKLTASVSHFGVFVVLFGAIAGLSVAGYYSYTVPSPDKLTNRKVEESTRIYDRNGILLYEVFGDQDRTIVDLDYVSPFVIQATLSVEDSDFYRHGGFDPIGIARGGLNSLLGKGLQGGSTLTQQLTKNALLSQERTIDRKIKEFILSVQIENKYNKNDILHWYLNETPYGSTAYGIESASQLYFGKSSSDLNLAESAYLAGLPQRPSYYSYFGVNPESGLNRQKVVLQLMYERGWVAEDGERKKISKEEYDEALAYELNFDAGNTSIRAPHFVFYVLNELYEAYGEEYVKSSGLRITTTLDIGKQDAIQEIVKEEIDKAEYLSVGNASVMAINPQTREILTMVGSKDYFDTEEGGQFNVATAKNRQPGSSIKPLVYATALKQGYTASTVIMDVPTVFPAVDSGSKDYVPKNYDGQFRGPVQLRFALANSINITAVKMLYVVGMENFRETALDFGITSFDPNIYYGLSLALGGGEASLFEMTNAYAVFASGGIYQDPIAIKKVEDRNGNDLNYDVSPPKKQVLDKGIAFIISSILSDNSARLWAFGPGNLLEFRDQQVAVKTGTTDDIRDNWTIGYTEDVVVGVWAGNNDNSPMNSRLASGVTGAAPIWNRSIKEFIQTDEREPNKFEKPENVIQVAVGTITGGKPAEDLEDERTEYFIKGTELETQSDMVIELEICKEDNKLANSECKKAKKTKKKRFIVLKTLVEEWQDDLDKWMEKNYDKDKDEFKKFYPPTKESDWKDD